MTLQTDLEQTVKWAQAEVTCPEWRWRCQDEDGVVYHAPQCLCHGTGKVPRYPGLVEALTEKCDWVRHRVDEAGILHSMRSDFFRMMDCGGCKGTGRVLRSWEDQPQGALAGVEITWLLRAYIEHGLTWAHGVAVTFWVKGGWTEKDPDATLTHDILEAMKKEASHAK